MTRWRYALWVLPFLLGLGLAHCGVQLQSPDQSAGGPASELAGSEADADGKALEQPSDVAVEADVVSEGGQSEEEGLSLSPLSTLAIPLESALPERVLPTLLEPIGSAPTSISIPSLEVTTAPILPVGLEANGEMEVPGAAEVGWYRFGVGVDGGEGSAVLAAHIAFNGRDGVFRNLADLKVGADIIVERDSGAVAYRVTELVQYGKFDLPIDELFREDGDERLVLITCGGSFNSNLRTYDDNVVAIATPIA